MPIDQLLRDHFADAPYGEQERWAEALGVKPTAISRYKTGKTIPPVSRASDLARLLHLDERAVIDAINTAALIRDRKLVPAASDHTHPELVKLLRDQLTLYRHLAAASERAARGKGDTAALLQAVADLDDRLTEEEHRRAGSSSGVAAR